MRRKARSVVLREEGGGLPSALRRRESLIAEVKGTPFEGLIPDS